MDRNTTTTASLPWYRSLNREQGGLIASNLVGLFFILGLVAAPFLPETNGKPLPETMLPVQPAVTS